jgi:fucose 4-O-acetylase-like acetyltransferase
VAYYLLTNCWELLHRWFGWLFIPLGQNSLYVFTLHVLLIIIVSNTPFHEMDNFVVKSLLHLAIIMITWVMVKRQVLFSVIPR